MRAAFLLSTSLALGLAGCSDLGAGAQGADLIIHGGPILTMEGDAPTYAEAVVVDEGKIVFVGSDAEAMKLKVAGTEVKDLGGKLLLPGFIDPHSHFIDSRVLGDRINVSAPPAGPAADTDAIIAELKKGAEAKALKPGELLLGGLGSLLRRPPRRLRLARLPERRDDARLRLPRRRLLGLGAHDGALRFLPGAHDGARRLLPGAHVVVVMADGALLAQRRCDGSGDGSGDIASRTPW
jgi:hypothetical protein